MRVMLTGGGTGGHVVPNLAVIAELKKIDGVQLHYLGSKDGMERKLVEKEGVVFSGISCGKLRRYASWKNVSDFFRVCLGVYQAAVILAKYKPDLLFSKGGYVGLPVAYAAWFLRIPVIIHESDLVPGLANKMCMFLARKICLSFEETAKFLRPKQRRKAVYTGTPVRAELSHGDAAAGYKLTGFNERKPVLLVMGGSLGALQLNNLVGENLGDLCMRYQVVHLVGRGNIALNRHHEGYKQFEYLGDELKDVYKIAALVVTRGGANSLFELAVLHKKALVIPITHSGSRGDQIFNAAYFKKKLGWKVLSGDFSGEDFLAALKDLEQSNCDFSSVNGMNGTNRIVDLILKFEK